MCMWYKYKKGYLLKAANTPMYEWIYNTFLNVTEGRGTLSLFVVL